jgi:hypothetical protein
MDRSRIETHIKPLLGSRLVSGLSLHDVEGMQADIAAGRSACGRRKGRGGESTGGASVASRTISKLRGLLGHAARLNIIGKNPAEGVRQLAGECRQRRLSDDELRRLGQVIRDMTSDGKIRVLGEAAISCINAAAGREGSQYVFPADWGHGGVVTRTKFSRARVGYPGPGSGGGGGSPSPECFVSEDAERAAGCEMALDIESVLDRGVNRKEALS